MFLQFIFDFIQLVVLVATIVIVIKSIILRKKVKSLYDKMKKDFESYTNTKIENEKKITIIHERLNLLSRENVKLRTENEILKDRLRNMGIKDFDVIN